MTQASNGNGNGWGQEARGNAHGSGIPGVKTGAGAPASRGSWIDRFVRWSAAQLYPIRVWLLALGHTSVFLLTYWLAFWLRFDSPLALSEYADAKDVFERTLPWVLAAKIAVFYLAGQFHGWWRYVTFADLIALTRASVLSVIFVATMDYFIPGVWIPRSTLVLDCILSIVMLGGLRSSWRMFREHFWPAFNSKDFRGAILVGTDDATAVLAHQIRSNAQLQYRVRGLLATGDLEKRRRLGQMPVLGRLDDVEQIARSYGVEDILVTAGTLPGSRLRSLMETCNRCGLNLKIIPGLEDRISGDCRVPVRSIEINDLLRRDPVRLDTEAIGKLLQGRTVMVTGAGGSIGSEICRQVLKFNPRALILVGRGENRVFTIEQELRTRTPVEIHARIADVTDRSRMRRLFQRYQPDVVFHAAAHKHVPLMESNVGEAIKNNVLGTKCVADLADEFKANSFVLISTDKAVHPTSVMGVSKQIAERYVHTLSQESSTRFTVVRFGNVLGSACSVVPIFQEQIRQGGPITITDPQMKRYFMTIPEASQLVLQAAAMGRGGEIFVLDMGEPVRIVDLARDLIRLSGLPEDAIDIQFTGIRPGEKLFEELYFDDEETLPTSHPKVRAAYHRPYSLAEVRQAIAELEPMADDAPEDVLRRKLHALVPEYKAHRSDGRPTSTSPPQIPPAVIAPSRGHGRPAAS